MQWFPFAFCIPMPLIHPPLVCIFCLICATHTPCGSHAAVSNLGEYRHDGYKDPNILQREHHEQLTLRAKRHNEERSDITNIDPSTKRDSDFLKKIFLKFGDGDKMSIEGLERLLKKLDLLQVVTERIEAHDKEDHHKTLDVDVKKQPRQIENNGSCFNTERIAVLQQRTEKQPLNQTAFSEACPLLIYSLLTEKCSTIEKATLEISTPEPRGNYARNWLFSILAVVVISVCGLGALVIIPMMQKKFYKPLLQFLVALAVEPLGQFAQTGLHKQIVERRLEVGAMLWQKQSLQLLLTKHFQGDGGTGGSEVKAYDTYLATIDY
ncbi:hypothetical protein HUJ05_013239 [Dendroctonus ponderosae]|nr:hypothetical protein HUJ05_013239 [Dendroctonus ponderosae]